MNRRKLCAFLLAVICGAASSGGMLSAAALEPAPDVPDWVPDTLEEVIAFRNQYGRTHVQDGYICVTQMHSEGYFEPHGTEFDGTMQHYTVISDKEIVYEPVTEKPEPPAAGSSEEAQQQYQEQLARYTEYQALCEAYSAEELETIPSYHVLAVRAESEGELNIGMLEEYTTVVGERSVVDRDGRRITGPLYGTSVAVEMFSFAMEGDAVYETDDYSWVPDSVAEYEAFAETHEPFSVIKDRNNREYVVAYGVSDLSRNKLFRIDVDGESAGLCWGNGLSAEELIPFRTVCSDTLEREFYAFCANSVGKSMLYTSYYDPDTDSEQPLDRQMLSVTETDGELHFTMIPAVRYDADADGALTAADLRLLSRYVTRGSERRIVQRRAADGNQDGVIDARDLTEAKRLLSGGKEADPVIRIDDPVV